MTSATLGAALAALIALTQPAGAADGFYARADVGLSMPRDLDGNWLEPATGGLGGDLKNGAAFGLGVGYRFDFGLRADAVVSHRPNFKLQSNVGDRFGNSGTAESKVSALTAMVNVYYDLPLGGPFTPFVGAGVGIARNHIDSVTYRLNGGFLDIEESRTRSTLAWALMAGGAYALTDRLSLEVSYRYLDAGDVKTSGSLRAGGSAPALSSDLRLHEVLAGVRWSF